MQRTIGQTLIDRYIDTITVSDSDREFLIRVRDIQDVKEYAKAQGTTITIITREVRRILRAAGAFAYKDIQVTDKILCDISSMSEEEASKYFYKNMIDSPYSKNIYTYRDLGAKRLNEIGIKLAYKLTVELIRLKKGVSEYEAGELLQRNTLSEIISGKEIYVIDRSGATLKNCMVNAISDGCYD